MNSIYISVEKFLEIFPEDRARAVLERHRWPSSNDLRCPLCDGWKIYKERRKGKLGFYRCPTLHHTNSGACGPYVFSVRTGTILEHSQVPLSKWLYCLATVPPAMNNKRGMCASKLAKLIGVTRRTASLILELLRVMDHYFWFQAKPVTLKSSHVANRAMDKFYAQPTRNEFLMKYRDEMLGPTAISVTVKSDVISAG